VGGRGISAGVERGFGRRGKGFQQAWEGVSAGVGRGFGRRGKGFQQAWEGVSAGVGRRPWGVAPAIDSHLEVGEVHEHDDDDQVIKQFEE
jgi:hypothetical protein